MARPSALKGIADEILYVPDGDMLEVSMKPNARTSAWEFEGESALSPFDGFTGFLVRTALIRSKRYSSAANKPPVVRSGNDIVRLCKHMQHLDHEEMVVVCLNSNMEVTAIHVVSVGGRAGAATTAREVLLAPILTNASSFVLVHNHPSGSLEFSPQDLSLTAKIKAAGNIMGVVLVDHVVLSIYGHTSMMDTGMIDRLEAP